MLHRLSRHSRRVRFSDDRTASIMLARQLYEKIVTLIKRDVSKLALQDSRIPTDDVRKAAECNNAISFCKKELEDACNALVKYEYLVKQM